MKTVSELIESYAEQAHLDTEDILELLLEFYADSGMGDAAITTLSDRIEAEGIVDELQEFLVQRGLLVTAAMPADGGQPLEVDDADELDLDDDSSET
jgi:hypothetical protein